MKESSCMTKKISYSKEHVENVLRNRSSTIVAERLEFLYEKFENSRKEHNKKILEKPKVRGKLLFSEKLGNVDVNGNIMKKIRNNKNDKQLPPIYMTIEKSYIQVPKNVIRIEGEMDDSIKKLIKEGRKMFPNQNGYELATDAVKNIFKVPEEYIKDVLSETVEKSPTKKSKLINTACSFTCYKMLKGKPAEMNLLSVGDETIIKRAILDSDKDYCDLAKELGKSCNIIYMLAKNVASYSTSDYYQPLKRMKTVLQSTYSQYKKRSEQYEGLPAFYKPCDHAGECDDSCSCFKSKNYCEVFCCCTKECRNRFYGCVCKAKCDTKACPCFAAARECIDGICAGGCKPSSMKDGTCTNMKIQLGEEKKIDIKISNVAGNGAFAGENIKKGDFVIEYAGELITQEEAEERGKFYDKNKVSYLFDLSKDYAVDGQFIGNKSRFLNHSDAPNCFVRIMTVLGDKRIGIYAERNITRGEELFFNYHYDSEQKKIYFG